MAAYYNEIDPFAAEWLRELIKAGHIAPGDVDERSIEDVTPSDLAGYMQCHFFAGIGGWSHALRLAGWPDDQAVWTGSCPCQPFSAAGKGGGFADERHLWPAFHWLIEQCRPDVIFGEQVARKAGLEWLDLVSTDLEAAGYTVGSAVTAACGFGAPHIRQRLYWLADASGEGLPLRQCQELPGTDGKHEGRATEQRCRPLDAPTGDPDDHFWQHADWLKCRDNRWRPVEPGAFPLADGVPGRVGQLRGYGNAIVPQQAQAFIEAYCESLTPHYD
jgi:DNA (cytosine-5)-methyltransferase 1